MAKKVSPPLLLFRLCFIFFLAKCLPVFVFHSLFFVSFTHVPLQEIPFTSNEATARSVRNELHILERAAESEFIVKFFGAIFFEVNVCLYMEYMDYGSLEALYYHPVTERVLQRITYCVR